MSWSEFRQKVGATLGEEDLRDICFDLNIEYDSLPAQGKGGKVRELIAMMRRESKIDYLIAHLKSVRPNVLWDEIKLDTDVYTKTDLVVDQLTSDLGKEIDDELVNDVESDIDDGLLDKLVTIQDTGQELPLIITRTGELVENLNEKMQFITMQVNNSKGDIKKIQVLAIRLAGDLREFSVETDNATKEITSYWKSFYNALMPFFSLERGELVELVIRPNTRNYVAQALNLAQTFTTTIGQISSLQGNIGSARTSLTSLRGVTKPLNHAVRETDRALGNYQDVLGQIVADSKEAVVVLENVPQLLIDAGYQLDEEE